MCAMGNVAPSLKSLLVSVIADAAPLRHIAATAAIIQRMRASLAGPSSLSDTRASGRTSHGIEGHRRRLRPYGHAFAQGSARDPGPRPLPSHDGSLPAPRAGAVLGPSRVGREGRLERGLRELP